MQLTTQLRLAAIVVLLMSASGPAVAQSWVKTYSMGSNDGDWPASVQQTTDGGLLASGLTGPPGDAWIAKLNPVGEIEWSWAISGWPVWPQALETLDGGYALGGAVSIEGADGCYDGRFDLAKFNQGGSLEWHRQYGPDTVWTGTACVGQQATARSIIQTPDGSFLMSGTIGGSGPPPWQDLWLVKVDSSGNVVWQKRYGGPALERQYGGGDKIGYLPGGGIVLVGHGTGYSVGSDDVWVLWLDANGEVGNQRAYGGNDSDIPYDLTVSDSGDVTIVVDSASFNPGGGHYGYAPWLLKLAPTGAIVSQKSLSLFSQYPENYPTFEALPGGGLALAAIYSTPWGNHLGLAEISSDGNVLWSRGQYPQASFPFSIAEIEGGGFLVASMGDATYDFFTLTRTDGFGGIDASCPISDLASWHVDTNAAITPSNASAVATNYPTVEMTQTFWVPSWDVTAQCITLAPQIHISPSPVDFGSIPLGETSSQSVTVTNIGTANLLISSMAVGSPFVLASSCAGFNLIPGTSCNATIELTPSATGAVAASLTIESDDPTTPLLEVPVLAWVVAPLLSDGFESGDTSAWTATVP